MAKINIKNVVKKYGKLEVVKGINLDIKDGEFVVLVGPSGCGKSTTLRMVTGLEKINGGDVYIGEQRVNDLTPRERNVAMVFQNYALYPHMNVRDNLSFSLKIAKEDAKTIKERVDEASNILGLDELLNRLPANLSGGQRQRVAMGRAIVRKPDVFLFDEPLSNLDAKLRTKMRTEIKKLHNKIGTTIVYVTHDQVEAMSLADRVVIMQDGNIEQVGTPMEVFLNPANIFVAGFIGTPAMNFFEGLVVKKSLKLVEGDKISLPNQVSELVKEGQKVVMGIRPENIHLKKDGLKQSVKIKVKPILVEPMGSETLVVFNYAGGEQVAKIIATEVDIDLAQEQDFFLDINRLYFFDLTTGKTLM